MSEAVFVVARSDPLRLYTETFAQPIEGALMTVLSKRNTLLVSTSLALSIGVSQARADDAASVASI